MNDDEKNLLWDILWKHRNHKLEVARYGGNAAPEDVCLECLDCNEVILDAELYTICPQETE